MDFDSFFFKEYDYKDYNCLHFTVDVWRELFSIDISFLLPQFVLNTKGVYDIVDRHALMRFKRCRNPLVTPGLCLFRVPRTDELHIATHIDGKIYHIIEGFGVQFLPVHLIQTIFNYTLKCYEYTDNNKP